MILPEDTFDVNPGSDLEFTFNWPTFAPDGSIVNADLTGWSAVAYRVNPIIAAHLTVTLADASSGLIRVRLEWNETFPGQQFLEFQVQIFLGESHQTVGEIRVVYK
jgi:hypothetical protein